MSDESDLQGRIDQLKQDLTFELQRRERPDRHPYQVGSLVGLLIVSTAQLILGIPPESALYRIAEHATILALNLAFIVGCVMCLWGGALSRAEHFMLSVRLGVYGHLSILAGCLAYSFLVVMAVSPNAGSKPYWLAVTSVGLSLGIAYASVQRYRQMRRLLVDWKKRRRG